MTKVDDGDGLKKFIEVETFQKSWKLMLYVRYEM